MFVGISERVTEDVVGRGVTPQKFHRSVFLIVKVPQEVPCLEP